MTRQHFLSIPVRLRSARRLRRERSAKRVGLVLALLAVLVSMAAPAPVVYAATTRTINVDNINDSNPTGGCTLREAIDLANAGTGAGLAPNGCTVTQSGSGTPITYDINLPSYTYTLIATTNEDNNADGDLDIAAILNINGAGASSTIIDGNNTDRVFDIIPGMSGGFTVGINDVTIQNGSTAGGGGIRNQGGAVFITDSTLSGNQATGIGGGIYNFGGAVHITTSTLSNNMAAFGGGIHNDLGGVVHIANSTLSGNQTTAGDGGGIYNFTGGTVIIDNSTLSSNTATGGNGGGIYNNNGIVNVTNSTLSANKVTFTIIASGNGGGIYNNNGTVNIGNSTLSGNTALSGIGNGGGIYNDNGTVNIGNSTLSDNRVDQYGGGLFNTGFGSGAANLINVTITDNTADDIGSGTGNGGGIYQLADTVTLTNTIVAGNHDNGALIKHPDCSGTITSQDYNLVGDDTGCTITWGSLDQHGNAASPIDPMLGSLTDNGGSTQTHAPLDGSPAIDHIPNGTNGCGTAPLDQDQRGEPRPADGDGNGTAACDIGALEVQLPKNYNYLPIILKGM
jgi:CSLREA domain-containing protein